MIMWLGKMFRNLFFTLDNALFNFIPMVYTLLMDISRTSILTQSQIHAFAERIQMLLGIFMLFKVSFSLIMYVVNPDDFTEKSKGIGKLAQNTVISLVLLAVVPYIFNMAYRLQVLVLKDNTLARLILPNQSNNNYLNTAGDDMAFSIMIPFFSPNTGIELGDIDCSKASGEDKELCEKYNKAQMTECAEMIDKDGKFSDKCINALSHAVFTDTDTELGLNLFENITKLSVVTSRGETIKNAPVTIANYITGVNNRNLGLTFRADIATATTITSDGSEDFIIHYPWPFTTIVAVVVILLLINFCLDIGLRSVKLAFLQLIAPIPIISYMDPKSGKDGMFSKWYKMCISTYASLFVRLAALYFGVYIISQVGKLTDVINGSEQSNFFVQVFIIIGVLMFVKQLPKILENLGIKLDGEGKFNLNPFKKMENDMLGGKIAKKAATAPIHGVQTFGKRGIAGAYSAATGRGFRRGWKSVDAPWKQKINKKLDEWAPDFAKDRQEARVARLDSQMKDRQNNIANQYFEKDENGAIKRKNTEFMQRLKQIDNKYADLYNDLDSKKKKDYKTQAIATDLENRLASGTEDNIKYVQQALNMKGASTNEMYQQISKVSNASKKTVSIAEDKLNEYAKSNVSARSAHEFANSVDVYEKNNSQSEFNISNASPQDVPTTQPEVTQNEKSEYTTPSGLIIDVGSIDHTTGKLK